MTHQEKTIAISRLFSRKIEWSEEDSLFLGAFSPGCHGHCCHGETPAAVEAELEEVIRECAELILAGRFDVPALRCEPFASRIAAIRTAPETAIASTPPPSRNRTPRRRPAVCGSRGVRAMKLAAA